MGNSCGKVVAIMGMNFKKKRLVIEYCKDYNLAKAGPRAGYSETYSKAELTKVLSDPQFVEAVQEREEELAAAAALTPEWLISQYIKIAMADPAELVKVTVHRCVACWPAGLTIAEPNPLCAVCAGAGERFVDITPTNKLSANGRALYLGAIQTKDGIKILMEDRSKAREMLAKILGIAPDKKELSGPGGGPVTLAAAQMYELSDEQLAAIAAGQKEGQNNINGGNIGGTLLIEASTT